MIYTFCQIKPHYVHICKAAHPHTPFHAWPTAVTGLVSCDHSITQYDHTHAPLSQFKAQLKPRDKVQQASKHESQV